MTRVIWRGLDGVGNLATRANGFQVEGLCNDGL